MSTSISVTGSSLLRSRFCPWFRMLMLFYVDRERSYLSGFPHWRSICCSGYGYRYPRVYLHTGTPSELHPSLAMSENEQPLLPYSAPDTLLAAACPPVRTMALCLPSLTAGDERYFVFIDTKINIRYIVLRSGPHARLLTSISHGCGAHATNTSRIPEKMGPTDSLRPQHSQE
jgi:hypothetical protein